MRKVSLAFGLLAVGLLAASSSASAEPLSPVWYLHNDASSHAGYLEMCQGVGSSQVDPCASTDDVVIAKGTCKSWAADFDVASKVKFATDGWFGQIFAVDGTAQYAGLQYPSSVGGLSVLPSVGRTTFIANGPNADLGTLDAANPALGSSFTLDIGDALTLKICNPSTTKDLKIMTGGTSALYSPPESPPYPVPELPTLMLAGAGLVAVGLIVRRRPW